MADVIWQDTADVVFQDTGDVVWAPLILLETVIQIVLNIDQGRSFDLHIDQSRSLVLNIDQARDFDLEL